MDGAVGAELILHSVQHLQRQAMQMCCIYIVLYDTQLFSLAWNISNIYRIIMENKSSFSLLLS